MTTSPRSPKKLLGIILGLILLLGLGSILWLEAPTGLIQAVVVNKSGQPLANAKVELNQYPQSFSWIANEKGEIPLEQLPAGEYFVTADARGYSGYYGPNKIQIEEGKITDLGKIELEELSPALDVSLWDNTKTPEEKTFVSVSGSKVAQIKFQLYQINLGDFFGNGGQLSDLEASDPALSSFKGWTLVREWTEAIAPEDIPEFSRKIPVTLDGEGTFVIATSAQTTEDVEIMVEGNVQKSRDAVFPHRVVVNKTHFGFIAKNDGQKILLYSAGFTDSKPLAGVEFSLFGSDENSPISISSNPQGLAELPTPPLQKDAEVILLAKHQSGQSYLVLPQPPSDSSVSEESEGEAEDSPSTSKKQRLFLYTERPLYRPGQKVFFKGILRAENDDGSYELRPAQNVHVQVQDRRDETIFEKDLNTNSFGSIWGQIDLPEGGEPGYYTILAKTQGQEFREDFEVDEYRKPEFKIDIQPDRERYYPGEKITFHLNAQYYFGSPVQEAEISYTLYQSPEYFGSDDFYESEYYSGGYGDILSEGKVTTNASGHASVTITAPQLENNARITLRAEAKDNAERVVTQENDARVVLGDFFFETIKTEYFATMQKPYSFQIKAQDYQDRPVSASYSLELQRAHWNAARGIQEYTKVQKTEGKTQADGLATATLTIAEPGYYRLVFQGKDAAGHKILNHDSLWVDGPSQEDLGMNRNILLIPSQKKFKPGDKAKIFVVSPVKDQKILLTVEGRKIFHYQLLELQGYSATVELPISSDWQPNVYVNATAIGKKEYLEGNLELAIPATQKNLKIAIAPSTAKFHPGDKVHYDITTQDSAGHPTSAEVSLGVVDESIYALKAEQANIQSFFWGSRSNGVASNYSFSGYYSGGLEKEDQAMLRKNFQDTAFWIPSVVTDAQGKASVDFQLPDNLTTWRATALAQDTSTSVGQEMQKNISSKDLIVRMALPRFFRQRDQVTLKAILQNNTDQNQTLQVALGIKGLKFANPRDEEKRSVNLEPKKTASFDFVVQADQTGEAQIQIFAKNDKISDGFELKIPVLPFGIEENLLHANGKISTGSEAKALKWDLPNLQDFSQIRVELNLDSLFLAQLLGPLNYLIHFPYGCVEQTTSPMLAALNIKQAYQVAGINDEKLFIKIDKVVEKGIRRLRQMQHGDGNWGWWQNDPSNLFMTAYALNGLWQAQKMDYKIPENLLEQAKTSLGELLSQSASLSGLSEKEFYFARMVAALIGAPDANLESAQPQSPSALAFYAEALRLRHNNDAASEVLKNLRRQAICDESKGCRFSDHKNEKIIEYEPSAWALIAFLNEQSESDNPELDPNQDLIEKLAQGLLQQRKNGYWRHTRETATVIHALNLYAKKLNENSTLSLGGTLSLNGQELKNFTSDEIHEELSFENLEWKSGENLIEIFNAAEGPLYFEANVKAWRTSETIPALNHGISVQREYFKLISNPPNAEGKKTYSIKPLQGKATKGETIGVRLTLRADQALQYLLLEDFLPSGFEMVENIQFDEKAQTYTQQVNYDEKAAFFVNLWSPGEYVINYGLRPELAGSFQILPAHAQEMYQPEVEGRSESAKIEVK